MDPKYIALILGSIPLIFAVIAAFRQACIESFAKCLSWNKIKVFVRGSCPVCNKMKTEFGNAWQYVTAIDCDKQAELCKNISSVPTWEFPDGKRETGWASLEYLEGQCKKHGVCCEITISQSCEISPNNPYPVNKT